MCLNEPSPEESKKDVSECSKSEQEGNMGDIKRFAKALYVLFNKEKPKIMDVLLRKYTATDHLHRESIYFTVPLYQKWQGCYAVYSFLKQIDPKRKICHFNYDGDKYQSPSFSEVEVKRGIRVPLLTGGWTFFHYKNVGFAAYSDYEGVNTSTNFYFAKKNRKVVLTLLKELRSLMQEKNIFKNEKCKVVNGCVLEFLEYPKVPFEEVILEDDVYEDICLNLIFPLKNRSLCNEYGVPWRRGVLLGGETGTGKTKLAKALLNALDCTVIWVSCESIKEAWDVKQIFEAARYLNPTLIVLEDLDFLGTDREIVSSPVLGELLNQLDGNSPNDGVFVLASTNRPNLLDKALANRPMRFDVKLEVKLPNKEARLKMINLFSKNKMMYDGFDPNGLAELTNGLSGAYIQEIFIYATLDSLKRGCKAIHPESLSKAVKKITMKRTNPLSE